MAGDQSSGTINNEYGNKLLNGEGLLHLVGTIKTEIASGSGGGGATYTAGNGIKITNDIISKDEAPTPLFVLLSWIMTGNETGQYNQTATLNTMINNYPLGKANVATHIANLKNYGMTLTTNGTSTNLMSALVEAMGDDKTATMYYTYSTPYPGGLQYTLNTGSSSALPTDYMSFGLNNDPTLIIFNGSVSYGSTGYNRWYVIKKPWVFFQNHYFNSLQGLTSHSIAGAIDELASSKQDALPTLTNNAGKVLAVNSGATGVEWVSQSGGGGASLPTDPVNEGTYFLTTTVSSGTATQAWTSIPNANGNNF